MNRLFATALLVMVFSCTVEENRIYSLNISSYENASSPGVTDVSLGILVTAPKYLSQPYLSHRSSPYELTTELYSKWEAPPVKMISESFRNALYDLTFFKDVRIMTIQRRDYYCLKINLRRFERFDDTKPSLGVIEFDYDLLTPDDNNILHGVFAKKSPLSDQSFTTLAESLSIAMKEALIQIVPKVQAEILSRQKR
ncbi:MAG: membrane integrity-associated transporter subunit PqiC [Nitrospirae bacterium]|nr:membrane integrity-associated transporter subunit PqiC [Nitrospirota bacterium]